ncbi:MAG: SDR family NAD(P)-dependent oxidoreductase [Gammaproteobacteria bacterium]
MTRTMQVRFDGEAAIVTGAGGGMGRCYALELARRGARVLVNDYGGDKSGHPGSIDRAQAVVEEIRAAGGEAIADATPVGTAPAARRIAGAALEAFGRIDILVNNAGIALPGFLTDHGDDEVENAMRTMLLGPFALMRAVWPTMRAQRHGRILNVSSNAALGIGGNASYGTSKAGLLGLTIDAAIEGRGSGIHVNAVLPVAYTRLIEGIPNPAFVDWFRKHMPPEQVARAMAWFLSRECTVTGHLLVTGGGRLARLAFAENRGALCKDISPEWVSEHWREALDMADAAVYFEQQDEMRNHMGMFEWRDDGAPALALDEVVKAR